MHTGRTRLKRGKAVDNGEVAVAVPVPVDPDLVAGFDAALAPQTIKVVIDY